MNTKLQLSFIFFLATLIGGCQLVQSTPTPLPGWRTPVSELIVDDSVFPKDWVVLSPKDTKTDPITNHIGRRWGHISGAHAEQVIWRAYTVSDAESRYAELLRQSHFQPSQDLFPNTVFVQFEPPTEISYQSQVADASYLACGWVRWAYCEVVARYRNYVVDMRMDLQADYKGNRSDGLTYEQIENIIIVMDAKFAEFLSAFPSATSTP